MAACQPDGNVLLIAWYMCSTEVSACTLPMAVASLVVLRARKILWIAMTARRLTIPNVTTSSIIVKPAPSRMAVERPSDRRISHRARWGLARWTPRPPSALDRHTHDHHCHNGSTRRRRGVERGIIRHARSRASPPAVPDDPGLIGEERPRACRAHGVWNAQERVRLRRDRGVRVVVPLHRLAGQRQVERRRAVVRIGV